MSTEHDSYLVENWDTETLIDFLKEQNLKLDNNDLGILHNEKITGLSFLDMTEENYVVMDLKVDQQHFLQKKLRPSKKNRSARSPRTAV